MASKTYTLPPLPYEYDALEPHISSQIMTLHHSKHHATYIQNLNNFLKSLPSPPPSFKTLSDSQKSILNFNAGGHINHSLFWKNLAPAGTPDSDINSAPEVISLIESEFGSLSQFQSEFNKTLLSIQGSGWGWLTLSSQNPHKSRPGSPESKHLRIITTKDQDPVKFSQGKVLFGVDMWEHAYYLQYLNGKAAYVENIWKVLNWREVERRFLGEEDRGVREELGDLRALL